MKISDTIGIYGYGTHEGVLKEWDARGRGRKGSPVHQYLVPNDDASETSETSGSNRTLADFFLSRLQSTPKVLPSAVVDGINHMVNAGINPEIVLQNPLHSLYVNGENMQGAHVEDSTTLGQYNNQTDSLILLPEGKIPSSIQRREGLGVAPDTFIHEFSHHLYSAWVIQQGEQNPALQTLHNGMLNEYHEALKAAYVGLKSETERRFGTTNFPPFDAIRNSWTKLYNQFSGLVDSLPTKAVRPYGLYDHYEWFATSAEAWFKGGLARERLKENSPETYKLVDSVMTGKFLKK